MDSSQGVTFKKVLMVGITAALVCVVIVGGVFIYLNKKTAAGIQKNVILDEINSTNPAEDLGPREGGIFTRMGVINPPFIEEPPKPVATPTPEVATTTVVKAAPVIKPKPKPKPQPVYQEDDTSDTDVTTEDPTAVDDSEVTTDDVVVEDNSVPVQDNPGI